MLKSQQSSAIHSAIFLVARQLQFRQWSSRKKRWVFASRTTAKRSPAPDLQRYGHPCSSLCLPSERWRRGEQQGLETISQRAWTTAQEFRDSPDSTCLWLLACVSLFDPHWIGSRFQNFRSAFYSLASNHTGSSRVSQTSFARSLMRSRGKTVKSPSPNLAMMKRAARRAAYVFK